MSFDQKLAKDFPKNFKKQMELYRKDLSKDLADERRNAMRLSDAYEDSESETRALDALEKELDMREERLKEREKKVEKVEEKIKRAKAARDVMLQENEAINHDLQAAASARAQTQINKQKIKKLQGEYDALVEKKKERQGRAANKSGKNTVKRSLQALQSVQKEMQEEYAVMRKAKEQEKQKVMEERKQLELEYQQSQNQLGQQKALLNSLCAETEKLQLQLDERQASDVREKLQDSQMKAGIQNIYDRVTGHHESVSNITDPIQQLDMIRHFHRLSSAAFQHSDNAESNQDEGQQD